MQPFRPMRAAHDGLLDIGGARRTADQIDAARQIALAVDRAQAIERLFVRADHIVGANENEIISGRKASVVGLSAPETRTKVPVSAAAVTARDNAARS